MSVIVAPIAPGFILTSLGGPEASARRFLSTIAPEGSGRTATFITAGSREVDGITYYTMEYIVKGEKFERHNISVYTSRCGS